MYSSWNEMYNLYLRNFKMMNEYLIGYMENMKALNESFVKASHKMNEESGELVKNNENVSSFYTSYLELFEKLSTQWIDAVWGPILIGAQVKENRL
jgi:hypothetical protein